MAVKTILEVTFTEVEKIVIAHYRKKGKIAARQPKGAKLEVRITDLPAVGALPPAERMLADIVDALESGDPIDPLGNQNTAAVIPMPTRGSPPPPWAEVDDPGEEINRRNREGLPLGVSESAPNDSQLERAINQLPGVGDAE